MADGLGWDGNPRQVNSSLTSLVLGAGSQKGWGSGGWDRNHLLESVYCRSHFASPRVAPSRLGATALGDALKSNAWLRHLNLQGPGLNLLDDGVARLARALETNAALTWLNLSDNAGITCVGATALGESCRLCAHFSCTRKM